MATDKQLREQLEKLQGSKILILGIGNILKGDDGLGPLVIQQLQSMSISAELIDAGTVPENYIQTIIKKAPQNLLVVDAIDFGAPPGTIEILKPEQLSSHAVSTHVLSPRLFIDMICQKVPLDIYFIGVQPAHIQLGQPVSPQIDRAVKKLLRMFAEILPARK